MPPSLETERWPAVRYRHLMRIGIQLPEVERVVRWGELRAMASLIEMLELDSIWVGDHLLYDDGTHRRGPWEAWTQLAAIAAVTSRVRIGPLVAALPFHNPAILAKMAATVDEISGGRLIVGVGAGWNEVEFHAFGIPYEHRVARFEEAFTILHRLLSGEKVTFRGRYHEVEECELLPPPARHGGPGFMIGSNGPRMLRLTLPHVTAWNSWYQSFNNDPDQLRELIARIDLACEAVGRDPSTLEKTVAVFVELGSPSGRRNATNPITGSDRQIAAQLRSFGELGVAEVQLVLDPITLESIERAGRIRELLSGRW